MMGEEPEEEKENTELWMVPFADLMSIMVIFFLGLYAFNHAKKTAEHETAMTSFFEAVGAKAKKVEKPKDLDAAAKIEEALDKALKKDQFAMEVTSERIQITLSAPVLFGSGAADLKKEAAAPLEVIAGSLSSLDLPVLVEGHTDAVPVGKNVRYRSNWELSAARAFSVVQYLASRGLQPERLHAVGRGEFRPAAANDTAEGRSKNRRIEISVMRIKT